MNSEESLKQIGIYVGNDIIGGISCAIGYEKKFKWSWLATQLNTFVFIGTIEGHVDRAVIEKFSNDCYEYAIKNNRGWPRGLQSGVGSIAILQATSVDQSAAMFCYSPNKVHWSAFEIPIIVDTTHKTLIKYLSTPLWGTIYFSYFTDKINTVVYKLLS